MYAHISTKLTQCLIKIIHLRQDTHHHHDQKHISAGGFELVVAAESHLQSNADALDSHDADGAHGRADGDVDHGIPLAVFGRDPVDHGNGEAGHEDGVEDEACRYQ